MEKLDTLNEEIYIDLEEPDVDKAALKIQSSFRGHNARKELSKRKKKIIIGDIQNTKENKIEKGQEIDIDLKDPEVDKAALKIQSNFCGHKARKDVGKMENKARIREIPKEGEDIEILRGGSRGRP